MQTKGVNMQHDRPDDDWDDDDVSDPTDVYPGDLKSRWSDTTNYDW